jgi:hypothetical protein
MIKSIKAEEYNDKAFLKMPNLHLLSDNEIEKIKVKRVEVKAKYDDKAFLNKPCDDDDPLFYLVYFFVKITPVAPTTPFAYLATFFAFSIVPSKSKTKPSISTASVSTGFSL